MSNTNATLIMVGLFALRCLVPVALTILFGMWMNKLANKWEAEEQQAVQPEPRPFPAPTSAIPVQTVSRTQAVACWIKNGCSEGDCPAYQQTGVVCWQARLQAEGQLPEKCPGCEIYAQTAPAV